MLMPNDKYWEALAIKVGVPKIMCNYPSFINGFKWFVERIARAPMSGAEVDSIAAVIQPSIRRTQGKVDRESIKKEKLDNIQEHETMSIVYDPQQGPNAIPSVVFDTYDREPIGNGGRHVQEAFSVDSQNTILVDTTSKVKDDYLGRSIARYDSNGVKTDSIIISYDAKSGNIENVNHRDASDRVISGQTYTEGRLSSEFEFAYPNERTSDFSTRYYDESGKVTSIKTGRWIDKVKRFETTRSIDKNGNTTEICEKECRPDGTLSRQVIKDSKGSVTEEYYTNGIVMTRSKHSMESEGRATVDRCVFDESGICTEHSIEKLQNGRATEKGVEHYENGQFVGAEYTKCMDDGRTALMNTYGQNKKITSSTRFEYPDEHTVLYTTSGYNENGINDTYTVGRIVNGLKSERVTHLDEHGNPTGMDFLKYDSSGKVVKESAEKDEGFIQSM